MNQILGRFDGVPTTVVASREEAAAATDLAREPALRQYWRIMVRRKKAILATLALSLLIGALVTLLMPRKYTAVSVVEIARESNQAVGVEGAEREADRGDQEFYQTQYGLLRSQTLAERVAAKLRAADNPALFRAFDPALADRLFPEGRPQRPTAEQRAERLRAGGFLLLKQLRINPVRLSRLVTISVEGRDPQFVARVANEWGESFIATTLERRFEANSYARRFLEDRLEQLRQRLEASEKALVAYAANQRIINLPGSQQTGNAAGAERSILGESLLALNGELSQATADRVKAEARLKGAAGGASPEALANSAISSLRQRRAELQADYQRLLVQFEPGYPPARALQAQIEQIDRSLSREEARISTTIRGSFDEAVVRERELQARVQTIQSDLLDQRRRSIQYNFYQRDLDTNRQLYDALLQRYKEIGVAGGIGTNNVSIVDPADVPVSPSSPRLWLNLLLAFVGGSFAAAALTLALEQTDETISDPADVTRVLSLPLLGAIPKAAGLPVDDLRDRKSAIVEAYLSVQTNLEFLTDHGAPKTISVTSTRPSEGKSTTALAIATSLARAKRRVILVDGDMRKPSLHKLLSHTNDAGLSNYLAGNDDLAHLVHHAEDLELRYILAGPPPPNAAELLSGTRLSQLLTRLLEEYDNVVVDSPPVMGLADALLIGSRVEGVLYAIESQSIRSGLVRVALNRLRGANVRIFGAVLTKFQAERAHLGYGYEYGYGYGRERDRSLADA